MAAAAVWIRAASHQDRWLRPQLGLLGGFYLLGVLGGGGCGLGSRLSSSLGTRGAGLGSPGAQAGQVEDPFYSGLVLVVA